MITPEMRLLIRSSLDRAIVVKEIMITGGVADGRIADTDGYGEEKPIASNETEEGRAKNRHRAGCGKKVRLWAVITVCNAKRRGKLTKSKTRFAVFIVFIAGLMVSCSTGSVTKEEGDALQAGPGFKAGME